MKVKLDKHGNPYVLNPAGRREYDPQMIMHADRMETLRREVYPRKSETKVPRKRGSTKMAGFKKRTTAQKRAYAKKFTSAEVKSYRAGKRAGFLEGVHAPRRTRKNVSR